MSETEASAVTSEATAHIGYAVRSGEREWIVKDHHGHSIATIWSPCPGTFRCDPWPHILYEDAVEAEDFSIVLDYALNTFTI
jgi:hypothetical protein